MASTKTDFNQEVDKYVGEQLLELRKKHGQSQSEIGQLLKVSYQQVQKYEQGKSRLGIHNIQVLAETFNLPVSYFFNVLSKYDQPVMLSMNNVKVPQQQLLAMIDIFTKLSSSQDRELILRTARELWDKQENSQDS